MDINAWDDICGVFGATETSDGPIFTSQQAALVVLHWNDTMQDRLERAERLLNKAVDIADPDCPSIRRTESGWQLLRKSEVDLW